MDALFRLLGIDLATATVLLRVIYLLCAVCVLKHTVKAIKSHDKKKSFAGSVIFLLSIFMIFFFNETEVNKAFFNGQQDSTVATVSNNETPVKTTKERSISYSIEVSLENQRYDGGDKLYVLIDSVDLSNPKFEQEIQDLIRNIVLTNGDRVSINIYDNLDALTADYEYDDKMSIETISDVQKWLIERHLIANFAGNLATGLYKNTLYFFPAYSSEPEIKNLVSVTEFNP